MKLVLREESTVDSNVLPGCLFLTMKSDQDGDIKFKARFVIGGHRDNLKKLIVHSLQILDPLSFRILVPTASIHNFYMWTPDV